ncbi:(2Fe-2S)-binding protein [Mycolicibacterium thermoresistibile]|nr:(2Fe-2S)-binding protein [Mycolicibacterium thermoresistibile]
MFVCLCTGATSQVVDEVVAAGARTSKEIAEACGAGADCGRCRRTLRAIIAAHQVNGCPTVNGEAVSRAADAPAPRRSPADRIPRRADHRCAVWSPTG